MKMRPIDADVLIKDIAESIRLADEWEKESNEKKDKHGLKCAIDTRRSLLAMISRVKEAPTIEAEPVRHGRWITIFPDTAKCSRCGWWQQAKMYDLPDDIQAFSKCYRFCTACGARMEDT